MSSPYLEQAREIPVIAEPEVLVVGGGPAGIGSAIAAARNGAKVMLIERYGFIGGNLTQAMVNPMLTFHDITGRQVIRGIAGEIVDRLFERAQSVGHSNDIANDNASITPFDPEGMKVLLLDTVEEAGVRMMLHTWFAGAAAAGSRIEHVIVETKSGRLAIRPQIVIDCSADADVVARAGAPFVKGRESDGAMQPVTLFFRIGGVELNRLRSWMKENRSLLKDSPSDEQIDSTRAIEFLGLRDLVLKAMEAGEFPRDAAPRILMTQLPRDGQFIVNTSRLQGIDGTNVFDLTRAEIETRRQAWEIQRFLQKYVGGFDQSYVLDTGVQVGVRETRHIAGDYTLHEDDVLGGKAFPDGIACGTFAIDIHPPEGKEQIFTGSGRSVYEIPYRCLLPQGLDNLLVAGRSISATHAAFGSSRVMATCIAIGQGAGTAAAMAVAHGLTTRQVDTQRLRALLIEQGQYLLDDRSHVLRDPRLAMSNVPGSGVSAGHFNPFQ